MIKSTFGDWFVSFIQGPPYQLEKPKFWEEVKNMGHRYNGPWMIMGDFNEVLEKQEKRGGKITILRKLNMLWNSWIT